MATLPDYDPSQFVDGISQTEWTTLNDNPDHPLVEPGDAGSVRAGFDVQARHRRSR